MDDYFLTDRVSIDEDNRSLALSYLGQIWETITGDLMPQFFTDRFGRDPKGFKLKTNSGEIGIAVGQIPNEEIKRRVIQNLYNAASSIGVFKGLNKEAAMLSLALIETGCRPSEIANILPENIILDGDTPFIRIRGRSDMELKSIASNRDIPLVGVSLQAFREMPDGFARYRDKNALLSATLMKAFRARKLFPTDKHRVYSFRHSFEKRMLEAGLDYGLLCILMGHANSRPAYGDGGSIAYRQSELLKICHPVSDGLKAWMASYA
ncbi:MAG: tyrosine-type recombinase/integrase [Robiginitomaculum sp.]|nr:tyrosine-type recombinase/integrase [Robiginitomaculum sp.]